jgi:hypothetical protein
MDYFPARVMTRLDLYSVSLRKVCQSPSSRAPQHGDQQRFRHREERSDAAIHAGIEAWIATGCGLTMTD